MARRTGGQSGHLASVMSGPVRSAGLLPYRLDGQLEVLIAHPGGPWFAKKDAGSWSVVKGIVQDDEGDRDAAGREFEEETGWQVPETDWIPLGETTLKSRKVVVAWAIEADFDMTGFNPGTFTLYGREYPEIDRVLWVAPDVAREKLNPAQTVFIDRLVAELVSSDK
jgi:predicted NUDIX family NTP pyrophosphohydrolase